MTKRESFENFGLKSKTSRNDALRFSRIALCPPQIPKVVEGGGKTSAFIFPSSTAARISGMVRRKRASRLRQLSFREEFHRPESQRIERLRVVSSGFFFTEPDVPVIMFVHQVIPSLESVRITENAFQLHMNLGLPGEFVTLESLCGIIQNILHNR